MQVQIKKTGAKSVSKGVRQRIATSLTIIALMVVSSSALAQVLAQNASLTSTAWFQRWDVAIFALLAAMIVYGIVLNRRLDRQRQQSEAAEQVFRELAEASADWVWQTDPAGHYSEISSGFHSLTGIESQELIGKSWQDCEAIAIRDEHAESLTRAIANQKPVRGVIAIVPRPNSGHYHIRLTGWPFFDDEGRFAGYRGFAIDNTALIAAHDQLKFLHEHDQLTGLPNRELLAHRLNALLKRKPRSEVKAALIAVDIERFRSINEGYGTQAGDRLIQQFAARLQAAFGADDMISRYANDEFVILRERISNLDPLPLAISRFRKELAVPFEVGGDRIVIGARLGVYETDDKVTDAETCLKRVQVALTHAKSASQPMTIYAPGMDLHAESMRRLEDELRQALQEDGLSLVYQPQMHLQTGQIESAEALMRWLHPTQGEISPAQFIPVAERSGMITDLSLWALRKACETLQPVEDFSLAVNISALDFKQTDLVFAMERIVEELNIDPRRIDLEVTESVLISEADVAQNILSRLKDAGFGIALDDFGTGYAGLGYLQMFPFDKLKIDQSFVRRLDESSHAQAIVRSVTTLAHDLGLKVVAEGVERLSQIEQLKLAGCDIIQGYILGKPVPATELPNFLGDRSTKSSKQDDKALRVVS